MKYVLPILIGLMAAISLRAMEKPTSNTNSYLGLLPPALATQYIIPYLVHNNGLSLESFEQIQPYFVNAGLLENKEAYGAAIQCLADDNYKSLIVEVQKRNELARMIGFSTKIPSKNDIILAIALNFNSPIAVRWAAQWNPGATLVDLMDSKRFKDVTQLISEGIDVNSRNKNNDTALMAAAGAWDDECMQMVEPLLKHGANPNIKNNIGATPLSGAAVLCRTVVAQMLLNHGANINEKCYDDETTALMVAVDRCTGENYLGFIKMLLDHDADVMITDKKGKTVLDRARKLQPGYQEGSEPWHRENNLIQETLSILEQAHAKQNTSDFALNKTVQEIKSLQNSYDKKF